jgi:hypothetical protein
MNRIQFFVLTGLSSLVVLLLIGHILLVRQVGIDQSILNQAQQRVNQGQAFQGNLKQLAVRIFQDSQKTQDQGLKDLLTRQQITYNPAPQGGTTPDQSIPSTPASTH